MFYKKIFPKIENWQELNLENQAIKFNNLIDYNDPKTCNAWINLLHAQLGCEASYGGYLENRERLWENTYLQKGRRLHLGIDINVPAFTSVLSPVDGIITDLINNNDQNGGWGQVIIIESDIKTIFAHLHPVPHHLWVGKAIKTNDLLGIVGASHVNGGWFHHLHVQCMVKNIKFEDIDGYGDVKDINYLETIFPNPLKTL